jgi:hypothetical protein
VQRRIASFDSECDAVRLIVARRSASFFAAPLERPARTGSECDAERRTTIRRTASYAIGSGVRPGTRGSTFSAAHFPHPLPHPGFAPNHVRHVARSTASAAPATHAHTSAS